MPPAKKLLTRIKESPYGYKTYPAGNYSERSEYAECIALEEAGVVFRASDKGSEVVFIAYKKTKPSINPKSVV
jgi:hypothetical protein